MKSRVFLRHAEVLLRLGSFETDLISGVTVWSKGMYEILGIRPGTPVSRSMFLKLVHPDDRERIHQDRVRSGETHRPFQHTYRVILNDGSEKTLLSRGRVTLKEKRQVRMIGICRDVTEQTQRGKRQRHREASLSRQLMQTRDNERRRLARELHESAGQSLAALKMTLGRLSDVWGRDPSANTLLESAMRLADEAIREVRTISYSMYPPMLSEAGVAPALHWYVRGFVARSGVAVDVEIPEDFGRCVADVETAIFRIVQEALTNVHRHSGSKAARVCLTRAKGEMIHVEIADRGCGITRAPGSKMATPPGVGIAGMRERATLLGGRLEVEHEPLGGTMVRAILPAHTPENLQMLSLAAEDEFVAAARIEENGDAPATTRQRRRVAAAS